MCRHVVSCGAGAGRSNGTGPVLRPGPDRVGPLGQDRAVARAALPMRPRLVSAMMPSTPLASLLPPCLHDLCKCTVLLLLMLSHFNVFIYIYMLCNFESIPVGKFSVLYLRKRFIERGKAVCIEDILTQK